MKLIYRNRLFLFCVSTGDVLAAYGLNVFPSICCLSALELMLITLRIDLLVVFYYGFKKI